jgi:hypothetical protein
MPFRNARLWTGTLPDSSKPGVLYKVYLTGNVKSNGMAVYSWSQIFRHPEMPKSVKPAREFGTRSEANANALEVFPDQASFHRYVESKESRGGLPLDEGTKRRLNLEEVTWSSDSTRGD